MAFNSAPGRAEYTAIAGQTIFPFVFKIYVDEDVKVYLTPKGQTPDDATDLLTLATDYTVSINGDNGGEITLNSGASLDDSITLVRSLDIDRLIEYQDNGDLLAATLNSDQDYQTYLIADQEADKDRALKLPSSVQGVSTELPAPEALKLMRWNSTETALENVTIGDDNVFINVLNVDSIADLLLVDTLSYETVNVRGYYEPNDGGGGLFNYDISQVTTNNGGTIINGWARQYDGEINIKWFGAKGDATTDDSIAIQSAIDLNLPIYAPSGTYLITNTLTKDTSGLGDADGLKIIGEGQESTIFDNSTGAELFLCTSGVAVERQYNTLIKDIGIINSAASANTIGIKFIGVWKSIIQNVNIEDQASHGIYLFSSIGDFTDCAFIDIEHCNINSNGGCGINASVSGSSINYGLNIKENSIVDNVAEGILFESVVNSRIINTGVSYNGAEGIKISRSGTNPISKHISVENCEFDTNTSTQLTIDSCAGIKLKNNYFVYNDIAVVVSKNIHFTGTSSYSASELDGHRGYVGHTGVTMFTIDATCNNISISDPNWSSWAATGNTQFSDSGTNTFIYSTGEILTDLLLASGKIVKSENSCNAWVNFDGTTGVIRDSYNVSSVVRTATGSYTITFAENMDNANYAVTALGYSSRTTSQIASSVSSVDIITVLSGALADSFNCFVAIHGGKN